MRPSLYAELTDALASTLAFDHWPIAPIQFSEAGELMTEPTPAKTTEWVIHDTTRGGEGFAIRMTPRHATWIARAKKPNGGESWRKALGHVGKVKAKDARKAAVAWRAEVRSKRDNPDHIDRRRNQRADEIRQEKNYKFGDLYADFVTNGEERVKLLTLDEDGPKDRRAVVKWLENQPLWKIAVAELNAEHVNKAFAQWFADAERARIAKSNGQASPVVDHGLPLDLASAHKALAHSRAAWNFTKARKQAVNPFSDWAKGRKLPKVPRRQEILHTDTKAGKIWLMELIAQRDSAKPVMALLADYVLLAILFGGRKTELASLTWRNVKHEEAWACFRAETTKGNVDHYVPLTTWSQELLVERRKKNLALGWPVDEHAPVFYQPGTKDHRIGDYRLLTLHLKEKSDGLWIRLHDLRRTLATSVFGSSKDLGTVKIALGHRSGSEHEVTVGYLERQARLATLRELYAIRERQLRILVGLDQDAAQEINDPTQKFALDQIRGMLKSAKLDHLSAPDLAALLASR
jgi:integrase